MKFLGESQGGRLIKFQVFGWVYIKAFFDLRVSKIYVTL